MHKRDALDKSIVDYPFVSVMVGLAVGVGFVMLFSTLFAQSYAIKPILDEEYHPRPGRIADKAIKIAMENATLQQLFEGRDMAVTSVRDWGVSGPNCEFNWCAIILFDDRLDNVIGFAGVDVDVKSAKVVGISLHKDILIAMSAKTPEAQYFLSRYPDAQIDVRRDATQSSVTYTVTRVVGGPGDIQERSRLLAIIFDKSSILENKPSEIRLYCLNNLSTPAIGGDILGRIDNEGCFGKIE
jgi:hypothetical protein